MSGRAFYTVPLESWPARSDDAVEISRDDVDVFVLSAIDPNPALDAIGATRLGARLSDLTPDIVAQFTATSVERTTGTTKSPIVETLMVPTADIDEDTDEALSPPVIRTVFAGDDPASYE